MPCCIAMHPPPRLARCHSRRAARRAPQLAGTDRPGRTLLKPAPTQQRAGPSATSAQLLRDLPSGSTKPPCHVTNHGFNTGGGDRQLPTTPAPGPTATAAPLNLGASQSPGNYPTPSQQTQLQHSFLEGAPQVIPDAVAPHTIGVPGSSRPAHLQR